MAQVTLLEEKAEAVILEPEILLVVGALAFYIFDSAILVFADDLIIEHAGPRFVIRRPLQMLVAGKRPFIPNPLAPHRPLLVASVSSLLADGKSSSDLHHFLQSLSPFKFLSTILLLLFFPALPALLYVSNSASELLVWLAMVYSTALAIVYQLVRHRRVLELPSRTVASLALECLACPPFAINIVRKLTARRSLGPLDQFGRRISERDLDCLRAELHHCLDEMLREFASDAEEPRARNLREQKIKLGQRYDAH